MKKRTTITNPLVIGKTLAVFNVDKDGPTMYMDLKAVEEKANRISKVLGVTLTAEEVALFTFIHELAHFKQWKDGKVTAEEMHDTRFKNSAKARELEVEADDAAVKFIKKSADFNKKWTKKSLLAMVGAEKTLTLDQAKDLGIIS